jgi:hypothetical protein
MVEQDDGGVLRRAFQRGGEVRGRMGGAGRRQIGDAGENQSPAVSFENRVIVLEHAHPHRGEVAHPRAVAEEVFVVARDHVHPICRAQIPQRLHVRAPHREGPIDQVSRHHNQTGAETVGPARRRREPTKRGKDG